jgi:hypothetical protein
MLFSTLIIRLTNLTSLYISIFDRGLSDKAKPFMREGEDESKF